MLQAAFALIVLSIILFGLSINLFGVAITRGAIVGLIRIVLWVIGIVAIAPPEAGPYIAAAYVVVLIIISCRVEVKEKREAEALLIEEAKAQKEAQEKQAKYEERIAGLAADPNYDCDTNPYTLAARLSGTTIRSPVNNWRFNVEYSRLSSPSVKKERADVKEYRRGMAEEREVEAIRIHRAG